MFEKSLLKKDREELVDLFLSQGVRVHKFLNHKKLKLMFEKAEDKEFFLNVCMEQVLGLTLVGIQVFRIIPEIRILRLTIESQPQNAELGRL